MSNTVLLTGSEGFIGSYIAKELLDHNYVVDGIDNYSKYGVVNRSHSQHPNFYLINKDIKDFKFLNRDYDFVIACAASIGGIKYFHDFPYDLLAENCRIIAATYDLVKQFKHFKRMIVISSSMVFESTDKWPTKEKDLCSIPMPFSSYGFSKLAVEFFAKAAYEQYKIPYTIIRPYNACGIGELDYVENYSHVIPDLVFRTLNLAPNEPLEILGNGAQIRCYTPAEEVARGLRLALESPLAINEDFNISTSRSTTVKELATIIWRKIHGGTPSFKYLKPFKYDVQKRIPDTTKAEKILNFKCEKTLENSIDEVIEWIRNRQKLSIK